MVKIDVFDEWLDSDAFGDSGLGHGLGDFSGEATDAGDERVAKLAVFGAFIEHFENHRFLAGVLSGQHYHDLAWFEEFLHGSFIRS